MPVDIAAIVNDLNWSAPLPLGAATAVLPASVIHRRGPAGEIATVLAAAGWFVNPYIGLTGLTIGLVVATWFSGQNRGRDWRTGVLAALPASAALWLVSWSDPSRFGTVSERVGTPAGGATTYLALAVTLSLAFRALSQRLAPSLDPQRKFTAAQRAQIIQRCGNLCAYCGADGNALGVRLEMDHVVPHSLGGRTCVSNGQPLCGTCNSLKGTRPDTEARRLFKDQFGFPAGSNGPRRWLATAFR